MVHNETGLLVSPGDSQSLASAIAQLLGAPDLALRFGEAAFARATREFSVERYRRRLLDYYADALNSEKAGMV
jgi:glycosyltransferase involved in cell wall biosynthesis